MQSLTTIVAPTRQDRLAAIDALIDAIGNPVRQEVRDRLAAHDTPAGIHFMSLHAIPADQAPRAFIILEYTADGADDVVIAAIVDAIGAELEPIFAQASDRKGMELGRYLLEHRISIGQGLFDNPGLAFAGTPTMTVARIRREAALAAFVTNRIEQDPQQGSALNRLDKVRRAVGDDPEHAWALEPPPPPLREGRDRPALWRVLGLIGPAIRTYLWPLGMVLLAVFVIAWIAAGFDDAVEAAWTAFWMLLLLTLVALVVLFLGLRRQEKSDWTDERMPDAAVLAEIGKRENHCAQNHMISVTRRKPGPTRWLTQRLAFWFIGQLAVREFKPGHLGSINTIHAARWISVPGTRLLVFFSNYGGSWESYLEDFITRASNGLTGVWSNSIGFPRARNLFLDGATNGERFKRYARASMRPTRFWYSAYPNLTTAHVRGNAALRQGLSAAMTEDEAKEWLALFGSAPLPETKLESHEIQSLVFGGLGFMPEGVCLLFRLPEDEASARSFIATLPEDTAFGDGRKLERPAVITVALGAGALKKLDLPDECLTGFPPAFLEGMATETRTRILGDVGSNDPRHWRWGREPADVACLVYGVTPESVAGLVTRLMARAKDAGMEQPHYIALKRVAKPAIEPFGFVDGISQPIIRGGYQSFRKNDPIHLVQPGEFVIGYPDDRGNLPPEPELSPLKDPENRLPVAARSRGFRETIVDAPRAIARNGTYLVIRQLEQDPDSFWRYCTEAAESIRGRLPEPYHVTPDFIAAKLVGRWKDGSSLVRNPYYPYAQEEANRRERRRRRETVEGFTEDEAITATGARLDSGTARPDTRPADNRPIAGATRAEGSGDNDFLFGVEDPGGLRCPFGAHIRRANPRDSLEPGSADQVAISNRHRILRVGRLYAEGPEGRPGLLFMCLNGDIERQFEFIQQTWLVSPSFHGLVGEQDPIASNDAYSSSGYVVPTQAGPVRLKPLPQFVRTLGGGYFFVPSRSFLTFLGRSPGAVPEAQPPERVDPP